MVNSRKEGNSMKFKSLIVIAITAVLFISCSDNKEEQSAQQTEQAPHSEMTAQSHEVVVEEVLQANAYTYVRVNENGKEDWIAITKNQSIEEGQTIYYADAMEMKNFHSEDLNRDFESVWFVQTVSDKPLTTGSMGGGAMPHANVKPEADQTISVAPVEGGITIEKLFDDRSSYEGEQVKIKGKVVKVNTGIMGRNWLHIQDGTGDGENYDLTVTSDDNATVGQVIVVEGYVSLNKDFGSGYKYDIILEDSKVTPEKTM